MSGFYVGIHRFFLGYRSSQILSGFYSPWVYPSLEVILFRMQFAVLGVFLVFSTTWRCYVVFSGWDLKCTRPTVALHSPCWEECEKDATVQGIYILWDQFCCVWPFVVSLFNFLPELQSSSQVSTLQSDVKNGESWCKEENVVFWTY